MLEKQRREPGDAVISTVLFDNEIEVVHDRVAIADVTKLTDKEYFVRGSTALLDAVGWTVHHIGNVHKYAHKKIFLRELFIITTDGMENSSYRYSYDKICHMIKHKRNVTDGSSFSLAPILTLRKKPEDSELTNPCLLTITVMRLELL